MENFQKYILDHLRIILREINWYENNLDNMPYKWVRYEDNHYYSRYDWDDYDYYDYIHYDSFYFGEDWGEPLERQCDHQNFRKLRRKDIQYSFKCKISEADYWQLYTLTHSVHSWSIHECGNYNHDKIFLSKDFYDLSPEILFAKIQEILIISIME